MALNAAAAAAASDTPAKLPVTVTKPIPLEFDLGELTAFDANPLDPTTYSTSVEDCLSATARDGAQCIINQVLTTVPLKSTPEGVFVVLPDPVTSLPREKPLPKPKEPTKWELFAKKKGIRKSKTNSTGKLVYDEASGEWVPKWGYKGKNKAEENQWLVEVNDKSTKSAKNGKEVDPDNPRAMSRQEKLERIRKNERQMKKNLRNQGKGALLGTGLGAKSSGVGGRKKGKK